MKLILAVLLLAGCGTYHKNRINPKGQDGSSCTTRQDSVGVYVECEDSTSSFIPFPKDGADGESVVGPAGEAGYSCSVSGSGLITCTDGSSYQVNDGVDGVSCDFVEKNITCNTHHTMRFKQYLKCGEEEIFIKDVSIRRGC